MKAARLLALPCVTALVVLGTPTAADAHVTITASETGAGASTVLTASVGHGCEGSATTRMTFRIPEQILSVTPTRNPLWKVRTQIVPLDEPATDAHGNTVTERVGTVTYTARTPLPDGVRDTFELSLTLPDAEGETLAFPVIQTCEKGETAWTEVAAEGQDPEQLESPAPTVTISGSEKAGAEGTGHAESAAHEEGTASDASGGSPEAASRSMEMAAFGVGILGLLVGGAALVLVRRR
ncbi:MULTISPECIES: YcnI family copper-binding membrane protein [unclassified Nocardioides]|uniref:YcnI family copper-binding membrane protein n=1 Tax=unclassified Nocardioides TaxID=2615069 RepID=UPI0006FF485E|nr:MULTISPECIES: YcnI family protein [unclassified Nocardioides]KQY56647.1 hypothetical protein ASD30_10010 [Nocardioides sp. Root140]KRF14480.1 hypothetical protein ASH02_09115 [Nocardioides sp. Soil796]